MTERTNTPITGELRSVLARWAIVLAALGVFATWATCRMSAAANRLGVTNKSTSTGSVSNEPRIEHWTCTMHSQVREQAPGDCPICGMMLVAKYEGSDEPGVKPEAQNDSAVSGAVAHEHSKIEARNQRQWFQCTMPECGDQGSSDAASRCPVCGMKRERVETYDDHTGEFEIALGDRARQLAEVETATVQKRMLSKRIRAVGRVSYDETRYKMVSAWTDGRIDNLFADFTGMTVSKGDHLVKIYSPELLSAQEEYLQAIRSTDAVRSNQTDFARRGSEQLRASARRKLELLGVNDAQIATIERSGEPQTHLVIHAPIGGTIIKKQAMEGMYVGIGDTLYTIADLTHLWLLVDLYESDLPWVKPFYQVRVTTRSLPGEVFVGSIVFVDPSLNPRTRTVTVRIHVDNPALTLKPDMWVSAEIEAGLGSGGFGTVPAPDGDYACPMHPWETSDEEGACPVCDMRLVGVTDLPQYTPPTDRVALLSVPRDAVMRTGERVMVYVETASGAYRGVEIAVGPLAQDETGESFFPVLGGLVGDEQVVTRGNFMIDSQMQIAGKRSLFASHEFDRGQRKGRQSQSKSNSPTSAQQTRCPVMGGKIDNDVYADIGDVRVYFCCLPCIESFTRNPDKYVANLPPSLQERLQEALAEEGRDD